MAKKNNIKTVKEKQTEDILYTVGDNNSLIPLVVGDGMAVPHQSLAYSYGPYGFTGIKPGLNARVPFDKNNYDYFRPNEAIPTKRPEIIKACDVTYQTVPVVKNVMDLMSDFGSKGIRPIHPNSKIQEYYETWFEKVQGTQVSERFLNLLYRMAEVNIRRFFTEAAEVTMEGKDFKKSSEPKKSRIPLKYTFYHPLSIENLLGEASAFLGKSIYAIIIPEEIKSLINSNDPKSKALIALIPPEIVQAVRNKQPIIIPEDELSVYYYRKDSWDNWAYPMIYPILNDINILNKMKLADLTALDTLISKIRVWKLGNLENKIMPGQTGMDNFQALLTNNSGGGAIDIIWNPAIELLETQDSTNILGEEKYIPIYNSIYTGLGISQALAGDSKGGQSTTSISLKTFIERLDYGRNLLKSFWENEFKIVQKAKGFAQPAVLQFDKPTLTDEVSERKLLLDLCDRNIISYETVRQRLGECSPVEERRIRREARQRKNGTIPMQSDPYHNGNLDSDLKKIALQSGAITPSEVGLELKEKKEGEEPFVKTQAKFAPKPKPGTGVAPSKKPKGKAGQGRSKGQKDSTKRKKKVVKPIRGVTKANIMLWANAKQKEINDKLLPIYLNKVGKKNARSLSTEEFNSFEDIKFMTLASMKPMSKEEFVVGEELPIFSPSLELSELRSKLITEFVFGQDRQPDTDEIRQLQSLSYAIWCMDLNKGDE